jgi:hypothetical protein
MEEGRGKAARRCRAPSRPVVDGPGLQADVVKLALFERDLPQGRGNGFEAALG